MCCAVQMKSGSSVEKARPENGKRQRRVAANNDRYGIHDSGPARSPTRGSRDFSGSPAVAVVFFVIAAGCFRQPNESAESRSIYRSLLTGEYNRGPLADSSAQKQH